MLGVGILIGVYVGVKLLKRRRNQLKQQKLNPVTTKTQNPIMKLNTVMGKFLHQPLNQQNYYLQLSCVSLGLAVAGILALPLYLLSMAIITYTSMPIFAHAKTELFQEGKIGHSMLVSVLSVFALLTFQSLALAVAIFFYHFGENFLAKTQDKSKQALTNLFDQQDCKVWLIKNQVEIEVSLEQVLVGDILVVHTGDVIPVDGVITQGVAMIDQHTLTGEAQAIAKEHGDPVFASTLIISGRIQIEVVTTGTETTIAKIGAMLEQTADFKTTAQSKGEQWANVIAAPLLGLSFLCFPMLGLIGATAILNCSFGNRMKLIAPLGVLNHLNDAASKGILIKDGRALEKLSHVDTILFDKTGTLTDAQPTVGKIIGYGSYSEDTILIYAAIAEGKLNHPIATAILHKAEELNLELPAITANEYKIGLGVTVIVENKMIAVGGSKFMHSLEIEIPQAITDAMQAAHTDGYSLIMVAVDNIIQGVIEIQPTVRPEIRQIIADLRQQGIKHMAIISGDHENPTSHLAKQLDMDAYYADVLPEKKAEIVKKLQQEGKTVCFIGDGVNDALAIKSADVSISLQGASSIATDLAQVVLMSGNLTHLAELFVIANNLNQTLRKTLMILSVPMLLNMGGAIFLNFNLMATVLTNNISFVAGLLNSGQKKQQN